MTGWDLYIYGLGAWLRYLHSWCISWYANTDTSCLWVNFVSNIKKNWVECITHTTVLHWAISIESFPWESFCLLHDYPQYHCSVFVEPMHHNKSNITTLLCASSREKVMRKALEKVLVKVQTQGKVLNTTNPMGLYLPRVLCLPSVRYVCICLGLRVDYGGRVWILFGIYTLVCWWNRDMTFS